MANIHPMCTRSKKSGGSLPGDGDEMGNLYGLIDYDCDDDFDRDELNKELSRLSHGIIQIDTPKKKRRKKKKKHKTIVIEESTETNEDNTVKDDTAIIHKKLKKKPGKPNKQGELGEFLMTYILAKANNTLKKKNKKKKKVIEISNEEMPVESDESEIELTDEESVEEDALTEKTTTTEDDITLDGDSVEDEEEEESDSEDVYDSDDEEYSELVAKYMSDNTEDGNLTYFHNLDSEKKKKYIQDIKEVYSLSSSNIPLKFKVLNSDMDMYTKSVAINNLDKLAEMDISTGEYNKMDQWINGLIKLPFGKVTDLPVKNSDTFDKKRDYIKDTMDNMNKAIYGHIEAKTHILQVIGKWIRNPGSLGNVLAIQGPMGNGKTTLIKNGIAKSLNRPFEFVALGGASDSAFFEGHSYTYEGSRWGRIVDILHKCGSMNPIICFDELDKVSDTAKGDEIINMLIHMTDSSQNSKFQDNYFPGIDIDLSKVLFIFSFNDESKINRILKDRMYVIRTKGYEIKDKLQIAHNYLLPEILTTYNYTTDDIVFTDDIITEIVRKYTGNEEGVRNLKRCIEGIVSTLNIYHLTKSVEKDDILDMKIKDFKLPITLTKDHISSLLKISNGDKPPEHMYM